MLKAPVSAGSLDWRFQEMSSQLRRLIRADGAAGILAITALWALASLALDLSLDLPWIARALLLVLLVLLLLRSLLVLRLRLRRQVSEGTLAASVERSRPELEGQLLNALGFEGALADSKLKGSSQLETVLLRRALQESERAARSVPFGSGLNYRPFHLRVLGAAAAACGLAAASFLFPGSTGLWVLRNVLLRDIPWPRETQITLDREEAVWHCARGESVALLGWARGKVPAEVTVWIKAPSGSRRASFLPGANGRLAFTFPEVVEPFEFHLRGGDGRTGTRGVEVHDRPRILAVSFALTFPEYLGRDPQVVENSARDLVIPAGTSVAARARSDVPLKGGFARWEKEPPRELAPAGGEGGGELAVEHRFKPEGGGSLDLTVVDRAWGLESRPPARTRVDVRPDAPPKITLALKQKARVVTPVGAVGYKVEAKDDHGFSRLALETAVASSAGDPRIEKSAFVGIPPRQAEVVREGLLELEPLGLEPGMRLTLTAEGADDDGLAGPKPARSNSEILAVVGPEEFRDAMARARAAARRELEDALQAEEKIAREFASAALGDEGPAASSPRSSPAAGETPEGTADPKAAPSPSSAKDAKESSGSRSPAGSKSSTAEGASRGSKSSPSAASPAGSKASPGAASPAGSKSSPREGSPPAEGSPSGSSRPSPSSPSPSGKMAGLSRAQADSGRRVARAAQELRDVAEALEQNRMMDRTERGRFDAEVLSPLDDLGEERFPRTSRQMTEVEKSQDPRKESSRMQAELESIQESLRNILDRLSDTEDFADILHRLEGVIQLHRKAMDSTREKTGTPTPPAGREPDQRKEDL